MKEDDMIIKDRKTIKTTLSGINSDNLFLLEFSNVRLEIKDINLINDPVFHRNMAVDFMKFINFITPGRFNNFNIVSSIMEKAMLSTTYIHIYTPKIKKIKEAENDK